jgi:hypothetical protein
MATYPPYQQPIVDRQTGLVSKPWQLFFLSLLGSSAAGVLAIPPGSLPLDRLETIASPRLLGRGTPGPGAVEELTIGAGLALTATDLHATADGISALGYWTPITNGDPLSPEILFDAEGDCVVGFVPTPEAP